MRKFFILGGLVFTAMTGCASNPVSADASKQVQVAKSLQGRQCEEQGVDIAVLQQQLEARHIRVYAQSVGHDDIMRPQMCGTPDGKLGVFRIDKKQLAQAEALGFIPYKNQTE